MRSICTRLIAGICLLLSLTVLSGCLLDTNTPAPTAVTVQGSTPATASPTALADFQLLDLTPQPEAASPTPQPVPPTATADPGKPLLGRRIALDPGHGPRRDMGAVLVNENTGKLILAEDELNLDVALRCRDILAARGAEVFLTRASQDEFTLPWPPDTNGDGVEEGASDDLQHRIDMMNDFGAEVFISIHANSAADTTRRRGIQGLYCATDDCPFPQETKRLGGILLERLKVTLGEAGYPIEKSELRNDLWQDAGEDEPRHLFLLGPAEMPRHPRATRMPGVIIEAFYVTSPTEAEYLNREEVRQMIALAYADGLQEYLTVGGE